MISRQAFSKLSNHLKDGFFADSVILALTKIKNKKKLNDKELKAINDARAFLSNILEGSNWINNNCHEKVKSVYAYGEVVSILPSLKTTNDLVDYINNLINLIDKISNSTSLTQIDVEPLIEFFKKYAKKQLLATENILYNELDIDIWPLKKTL